MWNLGQRVNNTSFFPLVAPHLPPRILVFAPALQELVLA